MDTDYWYKYWKKVSHQNKVSDLQSGGSIMILMGEDKLTGIEIKVYIDYLWDPSIKNNYDNIRRMEGTLKIDEGVPVVEVKSMQLEPQELPKGYSILPDLKRRIGKDGKMEFVITPKKRQLINRAKTSGYNIAGEY